jgi:hypothetical protein
MFRTALYEHNKEQTKTKKTFQFFRFLKYQNTVFNIQLLATLL